jgi:hypothetical protein
MNALSGIPYTINARLPGATQLNWQAYRIRGTGKHAEDGVNAPA